MDFRAFVKMQNRPCCVLREMEVFLGLWRPLKRHECIVRSKWNPYVVRLEMQCWKQPPTVIWPQPWSICAKLVKWVKWTRWIASENLVIENVKNVNVESSQLISYEVDLVDQADQVSKYSEPVRENTAGTYTSTSRPVKLAWSMAGPPARSLRQKEARKLLHSREAGRPSLTAYPFSSERVTHVTHMNEKCKDTEPSPSQRPERSALTSAVGQPRLSGSASAMSLGLKRAKVVSVRCSSRCASVGSLRPLKVKGPAPPAVPPTAFLQKQGN